MALAINVISNTSNWPSNGLRTQVWQLAGTPEPGQVISWGVYSVQLSITVQAQSLDTLGGMIAAMTNGTTVATWTAGDPGSYGSWTQGNPNGFKPTAGYTPASNWLSLGLNNGNQFGMSITQAATATPTTTPAPTIVPWTPTPQPTATPIPPSESLLYISASNIGSGTQGTATIWADACGPPDGTLLYSATGNPWNNQNNIPGGISEFTTTVGGQLDTGIGIVVPGGTQEVWIQTTSPNCPECHGPYYTGLSSSTPTPQPTATPGPTATPQPTATPTPTTEPLGNYYQLEGCSYPYPDYTVAKYKYCIGGSELLSNIEYEVDDIVQIKRADDEDDCVGNSAATFCAKVVTVNFQAPPSAVDAILTRTAPVPACNDTHCTQ